jgi:hypothetical protein
MTEISGHAWLSKDGGSYAQSIVQIAPDDLGALWPLAETSGAVAFDISDNAFNGSYQGPTLNQPGPGDGYGWPLFDGSNDYVDCYSSSFAAQFNGAQGSIAAWLQIPDITWWEDGVRRKLLAFLADNNNAVRIDKLEAGQLRWQMYQGGVEQYWTWSGKPLVPTHVAITWNESLDRTRAYLNGVQYGADKTGLGAWVGALRSDYTRIGCAGTGSFWHGYIGRVLSVNRELTAQEIVLLYELELSYPPPLKPKTVYLPDNIRWRDDFKGAFLLLTEEFNWDEMGKMTREEMAKRWMDAFNATWPP